VQQQWMMKMKKKLQEEGAARQLQQNKNPYYAKYKPVFMTGFFVL
jgi:hypothetical protein